VSHEGQGHLAPPGGVAEVPGVMTFTPPTHEPAHQLVGEHVLAERYRLDEHVNTDVAGRQIWRGTDIVLRRPVAVVLRSPGGEAAAGMLTAAVAVSRLVHPHLVSVYDAIDQQHHAFVVREWVPGVPLRDVLRHSALDAERAVLVTHAIAEAVSALHAAGIVHGNIHTGTVLIADDGRVVLTDVLAEGPVTADDDVHAVGMVFYACLTGHWPGQDADRSGLPAAGYDSAGRLTNPRLVRAGIPRHLDEIAAELLDPDRPPPPAAALAAEFARLASQESEPYFDDAGPMGFGSTDTTGGRRWTLAKLVLGIAVLTAIAGAGAFAGIKVLSANAGPAASTPGLTGAPSSQTSSAGGHAIALRPDQVRIVDPPRGDRTEVNDAQLMVDGSESTFWSTQKYTRANFGNLKPGMGVLIDLGAPTKVGAVKVVVNQQGASIALRTGTPGQAADSSADQTIATTFAGVGQPLANHVGTVMVFPVPEQQQTLQYLLVWVTSLPATPDGKFQLAINEITVLSP
jgi:eukaryotic-like serine/threonine-protein kinase